MPILITKQLDKHLAGQHDQSKHGSWSIGTPKNVDASKPAGAMAEPDGSASYELWENVKWIDDEASLDNPRLQMAAGLAFERINEGQELMSPTECDKYMTEVLDRYGYGSRLFQTYDKGDEFFPTADPANGDKIEAAIAKAQTDNLPDDSPLKGKLMPTLVVRERGTTKISLLHEAAHMMEASWKAPMGQAGTGHSMRWFDTWVTLLDKEGFTQQANYLRFMAYNPETTGVINVRES